MICQIDMSKKVKKNKRANLDANCRLRQLCFSKTYMSFVACPKFLLCCTLSCNVIVLLEGCIWLDFQNVLVVKFPSKSLYSICRQKFSKLPAEKFIGVKTVWCNLVLIPGNSIFYLSLKNHVHLATFSLKTATFNCRVSFSAVFLSERWCFFS